MNKVDDSSTDQGRGVETHGVRAANRMEFLAWITLGVLLLLGAAVPIDVYGQTALAWSLILVLLALRRKEPVGLLKPIFLVIATFVTLRYVFWRFGTIGFQDPLSLFASLTLLAAELYSIYIYLLGMFVNIHPLYRRSVPLPENPADCPTVDVMIPSYDEDPQLLETTLMAAQQIRYPRERMQIYLLDDGGTVKKRTDSDPDKSAAAWERYQQLNALCERMGVNYLTRERNEDAKAGNVNAALEHTDGDIVLILDADHVPTVDILERTVGLFVQDPKLFLVQTPHFFINPDPVEKNLKVFGHMPSENEMFYSVIQPGLDQWNASFFCGSAALLRRTMLMESGGFAGETITEDAETALELHSRGYNSAYINRPLISGLQPETFTSFILQRVRWAQGMTQIFMLKNPLRMPKLRIWQRLGYLSSTSYWFFGFARIIFLLAPSAYLIFGLQVYDALFSEFLAYAVPHLVVAMVTANHLFGKVRWAFISELYELLQSIFSLPVVIKTMINPRNASFKVTPKGETLEQNFISSLSRPFYFLYLLGAITLVVGIWRFIDEPATRDFTIPSLVWAMVNFVILNAALGALYERAQRRAKPRMPADLKAQLFFPGHNPVECEVNDLSVGGAQVILSQQDFNAISAKTKAEFLAYNDALSRWFRPRIEVRNTHRLSDGRVALGIMYLNLSQAEVADAVAFAHGDSARWKRFQESRQVRMGIIESFVTLLRLGSRFALAHFGVIIIQAFRHLVELLQLLLHGILQGGGALSSALKKRAIRQKS